MFVFSLWVIVVGAWSKEEERENYHIQLTSHSSNIQNSENASHSCKSHVIICTGCYFSYALSILTIVAGAVHWSCTPVNVGRALVDLIPELALRALD